MTSQVLQDYVKQRSDYQKTVLKSYNKIETIANSKTFSSGLKAAKIERIVVTINEELGRMDETDKLIENYYLDMDEDESFENELHQRVEYYAEQYSNLLRIEEYIKEILKPITNDNHTVTNSEIELNIILQTTQAQMTSSYKLIKANYNKQPEDIEDLELKNELSCNGYVNLLHHQVIKDRSTQEPRHTCKTKQLNIEALAAKRIKITNSHSCSDKGNNLNFEKQVTNDSISCSITRGFAANEPETINSTSCSSTRSVAANEPEPTNSFSYFEPESVTIVNKTKDKNYGSRHHHHETNSYEKGIPNVEFDNQTRLSCSPLSYEDQEPQTTNSSITSCSITRSISATRHSITNSASSYSGKTSIPNLSSCPNPRNVSTASQSVQTADFSTSNPSSGPHTGSLKTKMQNLEHSAKLWYDITTTEPEPIHTHIRKSTERVTITSNYLKSFFNHSGIATKESNVTYLLAIATHGSNEELTISIRSSNSHVSIYMAQRTEKAISSSGSFNDRDFSLASKYLPLFYSLLYELTIRKLEATVADEQTHFTKLYLIYVVNLDSNNPISSNSPSAGWGRATTECQKSNSSYVSIRNATRRATPEVNVTIDSSLTRIVLSHSHILSGVNRIYLTESLLNRSHVRKIEANAPYILNSFSSSLKDRKTERVPSRTSLMYDTTWINSAPNGNKNIKKTNNLVGESDTEILPNQLWAYISFKRNIYFTKCPFDAVYDETIALSRLFMTTILILLKSINLNQSPFTRFRNCHEYDTAYCTG